MKKIGIIQPGRIGDIIICLPIALYYRQLGREIVWPCDSRFINMFKESTPWVSWVSVSGNSSNKIVEGAKNILKKNNIPYLAINSTSGIRDMPSTPTHTVRFDELKYIKASVPFEWKWRLSECLDKAVYSRKLFDDFNLEDEKYAVTHLDGSNWKSNSPIIWQKYQRVNISPMTSSVFDWLTVIMRAKKICMVDSCFANIVEGLQLPQERIFILRSDKWLTPTLKPGWIIWDRDGEKRQIPKMMYR